ncbi:NAD(P)-binding protein, partial [Parathielavia hyrcaniae]
AWNTWASILITGAATPAGVWAVQLAKLAGAGRIAATCAAEHMDLVRSLGADEVYDWSKEGNLRDWGGKKFAIVLDFMGGTTLTRAWTVVEKMGRILSVADNPIEAKPSPYLVNPDVTHINFRLRNSPAALQVVADLADRGLANPVCDDWDMFAWENFQTATDRLFSHPRGQVVLVLDTNPPISEISILQEHGRKWYMNDFTEDNIEKAYDEDPSERFTFTRWLRYVGSNPPDPPVFSPSTATQP